MREVAYKMNNAFISFFLCSRLKGSINDWITALMFWSTRTAGVFGFVREIHCL